MSDNNAPCPNEAEHTDGPAGYVAWHEWAARMARTGHAQKRCPGCGLYKIWLPKPVSVGGEG